MTQPLDPYRVPSEPPRPRSTVYSGLAIASMVLGIVWLFWIGSILALIFGYIARRDIRKTGKQGSGLAITGIVLGWVGVGTLLIYIIAAILMIGSDPSDFQPASETRIEQLRDDCAAGDMGACDDLFRESASGSAEERFGDTCGNRQNAGTGTWCE